MLTPYEDTLTPSSVATAEDYCEALAAAHPGRASIQPWGTPTGSPTRLGMFSLTVGTGPVRLAVLAAVHGDERSGVDGALTIARDLLEDPSVSGYAVSIFPVGNPWGVTNASRYNANGVDINRDFATFTTPEAVAIMAWLTWAGPRIVVDLHQFPPGLFTGYQCALGRTTAPAPLQSLSLQLYYATRDALTASGWQVDQYNTLADGAVRQAIPPALAATVQLIETRMNGVDPYVDQFGIHVASFEAIRTYYEQNPEAVESAYTTAGGINPGAAPNTPTIDRRRGAIAAL